MKTKILLKHLGLSRSFIVSATVLSAFGLIGAGCTSSGPQGSSEATKSMSAAAADTMISDNAIKSTKTVGAKTITVVFNHPDKFTDVKDSSMGSDKGRDALLDVFKQHIEDRAPSYLADGQTLELIFNDIDMAGDFEPWRGPNLQDVRIVKDIYPPRMDLVFTLTDANGAVIASGPRHLSDLNFMMNIMPPSNTDTTRYENALFDNWLGNEFAAIKRSK